MIPDVKRSLERYLEKANELDSSKITQAHAAWHEEVCVYLARFDPSANRPGNRQHDKDAGVFQYFSAQTGTLWSGFFRDDGSPTGHQTLTMCQSNFAKSKGALRALLDGGDKNLFLASVDPGLALLESQLKKFHSFCLSMNYNLREGQRENEIANEYDVDRYVYSIAKTIYNDVQFENPVPKRAGKASRVDFFIPEADVFIENKFVTPNNAGKIRKQIADDISLYRPRDDAHKILFFIYDPNSILVNYAELKDLENTKDMVVTIIVSPGLPS